SAHRRCLLVREGAEVGARGSISARATRRRLCPDPVGPDIRSLKGGGVSLAERPFLEASGLASDAERRAAAASSGPAAFGDRSGPTALRRGQGPHVDVLGLAVRAQTHAWRGWAARPLRT